MGFGVSRETLAAKIEPIFPHLDERRRLMGAEARALGHGGIRLVARAAGVRWASTSWRRVPSCWAGSAGWAADATWAMFRDAEY
jgi:hypothetical protein